MSITYGIIQNNIVKKVSGEWPKTKLPALRESIRKWKWLVKTIREGKLPPRTYADTCALCVLYLILDAEENKNCNGCPVREKTKRHGCQGTPYFSYLDAIDDNEFEKAVSAANKEIKFLESLLP